MAGQDFPEVAARVLEALSSQSADIRVMVERLTKIETRMESHFETNDRLEAEIKDLRLEQAAIRERLTVVRTQFAAALVVVSVLVPAAMRYLHLT